MFKTLGLSIKPSLRLVRWNSTSGPVLPPLMATLRTDLKTAMRAKDTPRLNVLRALISETNNAAKTASPIQTDVQLLSLIRKRAAAAKEAAQQFAEADRPDLKEKEDQQITVLEEYAGQVKTLSTEELQAAITQELASFKASGQKPQVGQVLKLLFAKGGSLEGKPVETKEVSLIVKDAISAWK